MTFITLIVKQSILGVGHFLGVDNHTHFWNYTWTIRCPICTSFDCNSTRKSNGTNL